MCSSFIASLLCAAALAMGQAPAGAAPSFLGPSGSVLTPTAETLGKGGYNLTLHHRANWNLIAANYSPLDSLELGATVVDPSKPGGRKTQAGLNARWLAVRENALVPAVAVGVWDLFGWARYGTEDASPYVVATKHLQLPWPARPLAVSIGAGNGVFKERGFGAVTLTPSRRFSGTVEFDGTHVNLGGRVVLPRGFTLDVASINWELAAGATYGAKW